MQSQINVRSPPQKKNSHVEIELTRSEKFCVVTKPIASSTTTVTRSPPTKKHERLCNICFSNIYNHSLPLTVKCGHCNYCDYCQRQYVENRFSLGTVEIPCPEAGCSESWSSDDIKRIINDYNTYKCYEKFLLVSTLSKIPGLRWCPAPDCEYAVIAGDDCSSCPQLKCRRPECGTEFCFSCRQRWHPDKTCLQAMYSRAEEPLHNNNLEDYLPIPKRLLLLKIKTKKKEIVKPCPGCSSLVAKIVQDEECNHMTCSACKTEFCWICLSKANDMDFHFGPLSSCEIYGKGWSRRKTIRNQTAALLLAPVGIGLAAALALPTIIGAVPYYIGRKMYKKYKFSNKHKRNVAVTSGVTLAAVLSPIISTLAVGLFVPVALGYVYGVVPISNCIGSKTRLRFHDESDRIATDAVNRE